MTGVHFASQGLVPSPCLAATLGSGARTACLVGKKFREELDSRFKPCNLVEIMPRLMEK